MMTLSFGYVMMFSSPPLSFPPNGAWRVPQELFPEPEPDDLNPGGFSLDDDDPGPGQGLFITLPAEQLTLAGFCQGNA